MAILQRAIQIVADSETALRKLLGEAAEKGDYVVVETLVRWASTLNEIRREEQPLAIVPQAESLERPTTERVVPARSDKPVNLRSYCKTTFLSPLCQGMGDAR